MAKILKKKAAKKPKKAIVLKVNASFDELMKIAANAPKNKTK